MHTDVPLFLFCFLFNLSSSLLLISHEGNEWKLTVKLLPISLFTVFCFCFFFCMNHFSVFGIFCLFMVDPTVFFSLALRKYGLMRSVLCGGSLLLYVYIVYYLKLNCNAIWTIKSKTMLLLTWNDFFASRQWPLLHLYTSMCTYYYYIRTMFTWDIGVQCQWPFRSSFIYCIMYI